MTYNRDGFSAYVNEPIKPKHPFNKGATMNQPFHLTFQDNMSSINTENDCLTFSSNNPLNFSSQDSNISIDTENDYLTFSSMNDIVNNSLDNLTIEGAKTMKDTNINEYPDITTNTRSFTPSPSIPTNLLLAVLYFVGKYGAETLIKSIIELNKTNITLDDITNLQTSIKRPEDYFK